MNWNYLILFGFALRIVYHITNEKYPYNFKTPEGAANLNKTLFSGLITIASWYLAFFLHFADYITDGWKLIGLWGLYTRIGWSIDSFFLAAMNVIEQKILNKIKPDTIRNLKN